MEITKLMRQHQNRVVLCTNKSVWGEVGDNWTTYQCASAADCKTERDFVEIANLMWQRRIRLAGCPMHKRDSVG